MDLFSLMWSQEFETMTYFSTWKTTSGLLFQKKKCRLKIIHKDIVYVHKTGFSKKLLWNFTVSTVCTWTNFSYSLSQYSLHFVFWISVFIFLIFLRKKSVMFSHTFAVLGAVVSCVCVMAKAPELLMLGRFITGINCGKNYQNL